MFAADTSTPVMRAYGSALASSNASTPVPQPTSRMRIARSCGAWATKISRIRATRVSGALQVAASNGVDMAQRADQIARRHEREPGSIRAQPREQLGVGREHRRVAAESRFAVRQQHDDAAGARDRLRAVGPQL